MPNIIIVAGIFVVLILVVAAFVAQQMSNVEKMNLNRKPKTLSDKLRESGRAPMDTERFREIVMSGGSQEVEPLLDISGTGSSSSESPDDIDIKSLEMSGYRINLEGKDLQTIYAEYLSAKNLNPFDVEPDFTLGIAYMRFAQYDKAQNQFQKVIDSKPEFPGIYYYLGESLRCNGQYYEAMNAYKKSWEMDKKLSEKTAGLS
jgi:tetratricopeptide (TPR) repeat protein